MAEIEVEESFETSTVRRKTVRHSFNIEEVSSLQKEANECMGCVQMSFNAHEKTTAHIYKETDLELDGYKKKTSLSLSIFSL